MRYSTAESVGRAILMHDVDRAIIYRDIASDNPRGYWLDGDEAMQEIVEEAVEGGETTAAVQADILICSGIYPMVVQVFLDYWAEPQGAVGLPNND